MKKYLAIAEKRSQAGDIAKALGLKSGRNTFEGSWKDGRLTVVWASGHLLRIKTPDEIINDLSWQDPPSKYIPIPRDYNLVVNDNGDGRVSGMLQHIKNHMQGVDCVIIATDSDREGEAIGRNIVHHFGYQGEVKRAWFSAGLDKKSILNAMNNLKHSTETIAWWRASEARSRTDILYAYLTRAYTYYSKYGKFGSYMAQGRGRSSVMSVGRLQTVIVNMIAERDVEIANFVAKDHFTFKGIFNFKGCEIEASYSPSVTQKHIDSAPTGVTWEEQRSQGDNTPLDKPLFTDNAVANDFVQRLKDNSDTTKIVDSTSSTEKENPPSTFELADAQAALSKKLGVDSGVAQTILEDLYEQGWTSYARTNHSELPMNLYEDSERNGMFNAVAQIASLSSIVSEAKSIHDGTHPKYPKFTPNIFSSKEMEHYGIVPTSQVMTPSAFSSIQAKKADKGKVKHTSDHMRQAYLIIATQFIQAMLPPTTYAAQKVKISVQTKDILGNETSVFSAKARTITDSGWRGIIGSNLPSELTFPSLNNGDNGSIVDIKKKQQRTKPPSRYTKTLLPKALSNVGKDVKDPKYRKILAQSKGIGQPATRKTAIETVIERGYVKTKGDTLFSEEKGRELVKYVPNWIKQPETSAILEDFLSKIADQKNDNEGIGMRDKFVASQIERIEKLISYMLDKFQGDLGERVKSAPKVVSTKMKKFIKSIASKKGIDIPRGTLSDPMMAKAFIDEHYDPNEKSDYTPSEKQIKLAERLAGSIAEAELTEEIKNSGQKIKAFIDKWIKLDPPSPKQLDLVRKIKADLDSGVSVPDDIETSKVAASEFINKHMKRG